MSANIAHYEVLDLLGKGGMGEVHRAKDTKLGREVALKFLPDDLARDQERLDRFRREAKVLASLNHPNIAAIYGLEEENGRHYLVMELAEGEDLSERIGRGPIPEEEVLDIARQIAAGLEEAHEKGIVHRDLKPGNIKLGSDGKVKVLDFGLARAFAGETAGEENLQNSPTITAAAGNTGVILGTAAYMSPEQARGKKVDRRADIWAFGVVLFEMLTGKRMFHEETISDTLAAVLRADPDWDALPESTSHGMRRLLERCLERDPLRRLRDVGEARIFLEDGAQDSSILTSSSSMIAKATPEPSVQRTPAWLIGALALVAAAAGLMIGWQVLGRPGPAPLMNTNLNAPEDVVFHLLSTQPGPGAISPDGSMVAFCGRDANGVRLYLRRLDSPEATVLSGTDGAAYPFWSPDSRYIAFNAGDKLKKVAVAGGPPTTLCAADNMKGGSWNEDGVIVFAPSHNTGIYRVSASGGDPVALTELEEGGDVNSHRHPRFLPDGTHYLFLARARNTGDEGLVFMGSLEGGEPQRLTTSTTAAEYSAGHLLTVREGILCAATFDVGSAELGEDWIPLVENVLVVSRGAACGVYSPTEDGMLLYQVSSGTSERGLEWVGASGSQLGSVGESGSLFRPRISPDGTQAVVEVSDLENEATDLWLVDLESGLRSRFTFDPGDETEAIWTPDGRAVVYTAEMDSTYQVVRRPVEGTGGATVLYESALETVVSDIAPDGSVAYLEQEDTTTDGDILALDLATGELRPVITDNLFQGGARVSPDGRWMAYHTATESTWETIVRPISGGTRRWQVDTEGGVFPFWSPDGAYLYYIDFGGQVMQVPVQLDGDTFRASAPKSFARVAPPDGSGFFVSLHPDGERILHVGGEVSDDETGYLHLVTDWRRGLAN